jgi:23S rRNA pseudouridine2605 synthase
MRYICKKLIMAKANKHSDKRVGKSRPSKLKAPETSYTNKKSTPSKSKLKGKANTSPDEIRLNKYISNSGMCSRREADMHISIGSVMVNGKVVTEMGYKVRLEDEVRFDGARINPEKKAYVLLNKPKGFATTTSEGKGRTVMDLVANATDAKIRPIGRLGRNSLGLILFTNDEQMHAKFTNSKHGVTRLFHMELDKPLKFEHLKSIQEGFKYEGKLISVEAISYIEGVSKNEIGLQIKNTGNTILRLIFDHFKYEIVKMDCVTIGPLSKKDLPRGHWKHLTEQEINNLMML